MSSVEHDARPGDGGAGSGPRTLRSEADRALLWRAAEGRCRRCGDELGEDWQADHVAAWTGTQRTNVHEMQALCARCNREKGAGEMEYLKFLRPGQREALRVILERVRAGEAFTSIILPTGYGKSDVARLAAVELWRDGVAPWSLIISPNEYLRDQMVEVVPVQGMLGRYRLLRVAERAMRYSAIKGIGTDYAANRECFLSATIQLIQQNSGHFADWIESARHRSGKRPVVIVDEIHTHSTMKQWGRAIRELADAGACVIVMTATAMREDGDPIVGFRLTQVEHEPLEYRRVLPGRRPDTVRVQTWEGTRHHYLLDADCEWTFEQAWEENVLCHMNDHWLDVDLSTIDPDGTRWPQRKLSDLSATEARRVLGTVVRHPAVLREACRLFVSWLRHVHRASPAAYGDCAGVIFCANDEGEQANEHAEQIKATLHAIDPSLRVVIATTAEDNGRLKYGKRALESFTVDGEGDVLIVKQMAGLGLDAPRLKVVLDLSPVRSAVAYIQRVNRATRPYNGMHTAHLISLADVLAVGCWAEFVQQQGGAASDEMTLVAEEEKARGEARDQPTWMIHGAYASDVHDTRRNVAPFQVLHRVARCLERFPVLLASMTIPEIAKQSEGLVPDMDDAEIAEVDGALNTGDAAADLRSLIGATMRGIANVRFQIEQGRRYAGKSDSAAYEGVIKAAWGQLYQRANVAAATELGRINDLAVLERLRAEAEAMGASLLDDPGSPL